MDEVPTTTHSEEIEEKMAKELLEEEKAPQVMIGWGGDGEGQGGKVGALFVSVELRNKKLKEMNQIIQFMLTIRNPIIDFQFYKCAFQL